MRNSWNRQFGFGQQCGYCWYGMDGLIRVDRRHRRHAPWCSVLPKTCQPPAAPCQCTFQSLSCPGGEGPRKDQPPHLPPVTERVEAKKNNGSIIFSDPIIHF